MSLSIGAATDYLVTKATAAVSGITVGGEPVSVVDGWPDELALGMFVIGLSAPPPEPDGQSHGTRQRSLIGNTFADEDYVIPCYIDVRISGTTQKTARDKAHTIFDTFWALLLADRTLGGALTFPAEVANFASTPSNVGNAAEPGRRQLVTFDIHCQNITT